MASMFQSILKYILSYTEDRFSSAEEVATDLLPLQVNFISG